MDKIEKLKNGLKERCSALLRELDLVHAAISETTSKPPHFESSKVWLRKLEKWHEELHNLVKNCPKIDSE